MKKEVTFTCETKTEQGTFIVFLALPMDAAQFSNIWAELKKTGNPQNTLAHFGQEVELRERTNEGVVSLAMKNAPRVFSMRAPAEVVAHLLGEAEVYVAYVT